MTNSQEEQLFLATLQECLQADNEKRTAAEVFPSYSNVIQISCLSLVANLSRNTR